MTIASANVGAGFYLLVVALGGCWRLSCCMVAVAAEHLELARVVDDQLGRFGIAGRVEAMTEGESKLLCLVGHGPRAVLEVTRELETYRTVAEVDRRRFIERLARELTSRRRNTIPVSKARFAWLDWVRPVLGVAGVAGAIYGAWVWLGRPARDAIEARPTAATSAVAAVSRSAPPLTDLATRCNAAKSRISTGGSVGPIDVDGWVVQIMLLARSVELTPTAEFWKAFLAQDPSSQALRVDWAEAPELKSEVDPSTFVVLSTEPLATVVPDTRSGVRFTFTGKYVTRYFDETTRLSLIRLASALYEASGSNVGALYARCAEGKTHHLGSWFRGADLAMSSLSLVAAMGLHADVPHLSSVGLGADPLLERRALSSLRERSQRFDRSRLTMLLADDGGMLAMRPGQWATITFPFQDGNRAARASLRLARAAGLGPK